jgi:anti-sigma regulatory factor (Ser/Thr protein kinase)
VFHLIIFVKFLHLGGVKMKDISLHILDIAQNSISAKASLIEISILSSANRNVYRVSIADNGKGMSPEILATVTDPWTTTRTTRKVGMGIPLLKMNAELTGGTFKIDSKVGKGTWLTATFVHNNIDRLPEGDIPGVFMLLVTANPFIEFVFRYATDRGEFSLDTREVRQIMGNIPLNTPEVRQYLKAMISENMELVNQLE